LSHDWRVSFGEEHASGEMTEKDLASWTEAEATRYFSGVAVYRKAIQVSAEQLAGVKSVVLDFGEGKAITADPKVHNGMRALLEGPVREAAEVRVNGKKVGSVWAPPYAVDVTAALRAGDNEIEVRVGNTAINLLAGKAPEDYKLLNARYGVRFMPLDASNLQPMVSGMLGPVRLVGRK